MKKQMLTGIVLALTITAAVQAQSYTGAYKLTGIKVKYTNLARLTESEGDSIATYVIEAQWPSAATPAFSYPLSGFVPGDTVVLVETPDLLLTPAGLEYVGIELPVALDMENGQMLIPAVEGISAKYPTTTTDVEICSTYATIAPVTDNANISSTYTSDSYNVDEGDNGTFTWGFGIAQSQVFDWFDAPNDWADPSGLENFGLLKGFFNESGTGFDQLEVNWHAEDGPDSDSGLDESGARNRLLGITAVPGDTVTVATLNAVYGTSFNVGTYPILGGEGVDLDGDEEPDGVVTADWGYLFDPKGADDVMMNGDEPLQFTGYYFTYNDLAAISAVMTAAGDDADGDGVPDNLMVLIAQYMGEGFDQATATVMAMNAIGQGAFVGLAGAFGVDSTVAAAAAVGVGSYADSTFQALSVLGDPDAVFHTAQATAFYSIGVLAAVGVDTDDSDHDYNGANGRLVFQINNSCIPNLQIRDVYAIFDNFSVGIESEDILPTKFAVQENYPNPFNPITKISFDLPAVAQTEVTVWNMLGQQVATLYAGELPAGRHTISFDARNANGKILSSGVYIYKVAAGNKVKTNKMMLLK